MLNGLRASGRTNLWGVSAFGGRELSFPNPTANLASTKREHVNVLQKGSGGSCFALLLHIFVLVLLLIAALFLFYAAI